MDAFINLEDIDWSSGDEKADTIYLQWNESWGIWEQVIDEAKGRSGVVEWTRATALATARAEAEALKERADALARQADEWEGKYAAVSEMNAQLRGEVERLGRALREIDRMNDHPKWFRQSVNDIIGYALSKGPTQ